MKSFRYIIRLIIAFTGRFKWVIIASLLIGISLFFVFRYILPILEENRSQRIGIVGRFPNTSSLPNDILEKLSLGLTSINIHGEVLPGLADSWSTSDNGKTWVFKLKSNLYWQDGKPVTSDTLNYDFSDAQIQRPDKNTIVFSLQSPFAPFPVVVSKPVFKKGLLGIGEWKVTKAVLTGGYFQEMVLTSKSKGKIIYKFYPTEERVKLAYKLGQVDIIQNIYDPDPLLAWKTTQPIQNVNQDNFVAVFFNNTDSLLSDKSIRQGLAYAIDKSSFNGPRALSPLSPNSWAFNPQVKQYNYDPARAKELLKPPNQAILSIKLATIPVLLPVAERIVKDWKAVGIDASVQVYNTFPTDYQALLAIYQIPQDPDQYTLWHSTQTTTNLSHYKSPRIDKLLEDGRVELRVEERKKIYLDFQRFLIEDCPAVFLYQPFSYTITRK